MPDSDLGFAQELYFRIQEGEQSFAQLAREYSQGQVLYFPDETDEGFTFEEWMCDRYLLGLLICHGKTLDQRLGKLINPAVALPRHGKTVAACFCQQLNSV